MQSGFKRSLTQVFRYNLLQPDHDLTAGISSSRNLNLDCNPIINLSFSLPLVILTRPKMKNKQKTNWESLLYLDNIGNWIHYKYKAVFSSLFPLVYTDPSRNLSTAAAMEYVSMGKTTMAP